MVIARRRVQRQPKHDRIAGHIEDLKSLIRSRFPGARFESAPVPDSRWPGLWVYADIADDFDLYDLIRDKEEAFFVRESMDVHVISMPVESLKDSN